MPRIGALLLVVFCTAAAAATGHAQVTEIYKCVDARGRPLYTSDRRDTVGKKCELISREVNVLPGEKPKARAPANFPKESAAERSAARDKQRETLERELQQEESMLADARGRLAEQQAVRSGDEKNYARVLERLRPYKDAVEVHEKNIEALKRELASLSR
jgi:hypothetical protein